MWEPLSSLRLFKMLYPYMEFLESFKATEYVGSYMGILVTFKGYYKHYIPRWKSSTPERSIKDPGPP